MLNIASGVYIKTKLGAQGTLLEGAQKLDTTFCPLIAKDYFNCNEVRLRGSTLKGGPSLSHALHCGMPQARTLLVGIL